MDKSKYYYDSVIRDFQNLYVGLFKWNWCNKLFIFSLNVYITVNL